MNVLILGSGGREQALAWKIAQSPSVAEVIIAPGNAGELPKCRQASVDLGNHAAIARLILDAQVDLLVVGPEQPLVEGLVDYLQGRDDLSHLTIVGPTQAGAALEGSKDFAKAFMVRHQIPTAAYRSFGRADLQEAQSYLRQEMHPPFVLKADGLAAGKGVLIINDLDEACKAVEEMLSGQFGSASDTVVIEQYLSGIECSVFVLTDGVSYTMLPVAKDYKRIGEGDQGLNTGGMGAVSPVLFADEAFMTKVEQKIVRPTIEGLRSEQIDYRGFIFVGLMNVSGEPYVIEYNCRMGDPETEAVMLRIESDLLPYLLSLRDQRLAQRAPLSISSETAVTVIATSGGYPEQYQTGYTVQDSHEADEPEHQGIVFHAGTKKDGDGTILTHGGRVLAVSALGPDLSTARTRAYTRMSELSYEHMYYRRDIGEDLLSRGQE